MIGLIPARSGSKGIKNKNISLVKNKPLIQYSIEAGLESKHIDKVVVTSDSKKIIDISKEIGAKIIERPKELAKDTSNINDVIKHAIEEMKISEGYISLLQPTSPLRTSDDINNAFNRLKSENADNLVSVCTIEHHPYKSYIPSGKFITPLFKEEYLNKNRQELPTTYRPNGAIYIFQIQDFLVKGKIPNEAVIPLVMSAESSIDLDNNIDMVLIQHYLNHSRDIYAAS